MPSLRPRLPALARTVLGLGLLLPALLPAQVTDPVVTEWLTARSYARAYTTTANKTAGTSSTTWSGVTSPFYSDIQRVVYSNSYVYLYATGMPSYVAGNWLTPTGGQYTSWPKNRAAIHRLPRTPSIPATKQKNNGSGGVLLNGVFVWANGDAQSYDNTGNATTATTATISMTGDGIWNRLAGVAEDFNFDPAKGHHPTSGAYHNHVNPLGLRYQLGDHVSYDSSTKAYAEITATAPTAHSPLLGFANDGLPIYGPYGYSSPTDSSSGVRRMLSGFVKRNGATTNLSTGLPNTNLASTGRTTLPVWAASVQGKSTTLSSSEYGPNTTATYATGPINNPCSIGLFAEDYDYLGDLGYTQGNQFDLNRQNVRWCVTPEYPAGTYAYFVCIDSSGATAFPDIINQEYFGSAAAGQGTVTSISESVTEYVRGGQASSLTLSASSASPSGVTLSWPSVEGATYTAAYSNDGTTYTTLSSTLSATLGSTASYTTSTVAPFYKITLSSLASYDTSGNGGVSGLNSFATASYSPPNSAPTLTTVSTLSGATEDTPFTLSYSTLASSSDAADAQGDTLSFRIEAVASGSLTKDGVSVVAGATLLSSGESLLWTPSANAYGTLPAFSVTAWDGSLASASPVLVSVTVAAVNDAPTLDDFNTLTGATEDTALTIGFTTLYDAANGYDEEGDDISFRVEAVTSGTLTKNGISVTPGETTIASGDSVVWTPAADANGTLSAFSLSVFDGVAYSATQSVNITVAAVNDAPTLDDFNTLTGATEDSAVTLDYTALAAAANDYDAEGDAISFRIEAVSSGTLTKNGATVTPGVTLLSSGESLLWTPAADANGTLPAFTVVAYDGSLASSPAITVRIELAAIADGDGAVWDGSAGTGDWGTAANWIDDALPTATATVYFTGATPAAITLGADRAAGSLQLSGDTAYTLSGATLSLASALVTFTPSGDALTHTIASALALGDEASADVAASADLTLTGSISGSGTWEKTGPGTLTITSTNSPYAGTLTVSEGTLVFGSVDGDGSIQGKLDAATIVNNAAVVQTYHGDTLNTSMSGTGSWTLRAANNSLRIDYLGNATHTGGTTVESISLFLGDGGTAGFVSGPLYLGGNGNLTVNHSDDITLADPITGTGTLDQAGSGTLTLANTATLDSVTQSNGTLVFAGALTATRGIYLGFGEGNTARASSAAAQIATAEFVIGSVYSSSLSLSGGADLATGTLTLGEDAFGAVGTLNLTGGDTGLTATGTITGTAASAITVSNSATLTAAGLQTVPVSVSGATLALTGTATHSSPLSLGGTIALLSVATDADATLTGTLTGSAALIKQGAGRLTLLGTQTRTGATLVEAGTLSLGAASLPDSDYVSLSTGATLDLDFTGTDTVGEFIIDGISQLVGTHGALGSGADYEHAGLTGAGLLAVSTANLSFAEWAAYAGLDGSSGKENGETDDPDGDGVPNDLEFALAGDPLENSVSILPVASVSGDALVCTFERLDESEDDRHLALQSSADLATWTSHTIGDASGTSNGATITVEENGSAPDSITVSIPLDGATRKFIRLRVEED